MFQLQASESSLQIVHWAVRNPKKRWKFLTARTRHLKRSTNHLKSRPLSLKKKKGKIPSCQFLRGKRKTSKEIPFQATLNLKKSRRNPNLNRQPNPRKSLKKSPNRLHLPLKSSNQSRARLFLATTTPAA